MSHVLPITWHLIISMCFSTQNWFLIFPASIGNTLRNPPLYLDGRVKHHIEGRSDSFIEFTLAPPKKNHEKMEFLTKPATMAVLFGKGRFYGRWQ